jgi:hypothetical protein
MTTYHPAPDFPPDDPRHDAPADLSADAPPDQPLDAELLAAARDYHAPPPTVPADAMWAAIQQRRAAARGAPPAPAGAAPNAPPGPPALRVEHVAAGARGAARGRGGRPRPAWFRTPLAAAAVLALGVGIGRYTAGGAGGEAPARLAPAGEAPAGEAPADGATPAGAGARVASAPDDRPGAPGGPAGGAEAGPAETRGAAIGPADGRPATRPAGGRPGRAPGASVAVADAGGASGPGSVPASGTPLGAAAGAPAGATPGASAPLRAAADQHLAHAEALLTAFAAPEPDGRDTAAPESAWARDLLTTTRLLLDSPAGRDPTRRALLEDLELVLGQIARLPRADTPEERAFIGRAIRRGDLLSKLRTASPAGAPTSLRGS